MSKEDQKNEPFEEETESDKIHEILPVSGMYRNWFLDYASYVILERAVPAAEDGLKPVQRRILHAMKEIDDGRFNKVANVIGQTMQYHPHGDAAIGDALVNLGQKDLLIETQGNWGDIRTGDGAAAPRYIEARLSKFALEAAFNSETTEWQLSYDGRKKEPVNLPMKFPLLLAQGVEGIAVGLATKIMPHNFCELIDASVKILQGKRINIFPDFPTGGSADFSDYNKGKKGGKIKVRAKIEEHDNKTLIVRDLPFGTTTNSLIESIVKAGEKGKIKIKNIVDNTAQEVEILIKLASGVSPSITVDALYAFTDCEVSISPNACVIVDEKPQFLDVNQILEINTKRTLELLKRELEIKKHDLLEKILFSSLEKIFIENRIYRDIEECETWEAVITTIDQGLEPYKKQFYREITEEDIVRLTEIKIKRISKFDALKANELLKKLEDSLKETEHHLKNLTDYAIAWFEGLKEKYGKGRERKTEIRTFDTIDTQTVAAATQKLYVNRKDGFVGTGLKKEEYIGDCSELDNIIAFRKDGKCVVSKVADKVFMGKNIIHVNIFKKNDERMVYNMAYVDGTSGTSYVKRFQVLSVTRDKEYELAKGGERSKVHYFTANPNGEAEVINILLSGSCKARVKNFDFDFSELEIKGKGAKGNILTKYPVRKIQLKSEGKSTLGGADIWYDSTVGRLNTESRGDLVGNFQSEDKILVIRTDGTYELNSLELTNRYEPEKIATITKFDPDQIISAVYYHGGQKQYFVKRFQIETTTLGKPFPFISEEKSSKLSFASTDQQPRAEITCMKRKERVTLTVELNELIDVKGWKSIGNKLTQYKVVKIKPLESHTEDLPVERVPAETPADKDPADSPESSKEKKSTERKKTDKPLNQVKTTVEKEEEEEEEAFGTGDVIDLGGGQTSMF